MQQPLHERTHVLLLYVLLRCCTWWVDDWVVGCVCCQCCFCCTTTAVVLLHMVHAGGGVGEWLSPLFLVHQWCCSVVGHGRTFYYSTFSFLLYVLLCSCTWRAGEWVDGSVGGVLYVLLLL